MMVFAVQAASSAVRGWPSDHLPGFTLNVQVSPSAEVCQPLSAQSPSILKFASYCTSTGYVLVNATYDAALNATNGFMESYPSVVPIVSRPPFLTDAPLSPVPADPDGDDEPPPQPAQNSDHHGRPQQSVELHVRSSLVCSASPAPS